MKNNKIAFLATGDEITQGTILNTNAQKMAQELFSYGLEPEWHMSVSDDNSAIEEALAFLLQRNAIVIIIGGLGPTSDDKTRFALANYLKKPLVVDERSLVYLQKRYEKINIPFSDLSRQQALFPEGSEILENIHGSANGCCYTLHNNAQDQHVFMLPGPPHECLPMFHAYILPKLKEQYATGNALLLWKVFGVAEGVIAEKMDALLKPFASLCRTSFRWNYPYVDCKVLLNENAPEKSEIIALLDELLSPYQLDPNNLTATERLKNYLNDMNMSEQKPVYIQDYATGGILESRLRSVGNYATLFFNKKPSENTGDSLFFQIDGLENYWKGEEDTKSELILQSPQGVKTIQTPLRKNHLGEYAAELIAHEIYHVLVSCSE